ncbi:LamG-like jellyroll fold domain-containing protein [Chitinophaga sp. CB10]|uniref:LamG-like jellyroll fold domain-containing protein n=1 Tax=Chitinophaga sp. CB10 TaxID=1891659 RepID=UPI000AFB4727|nr:LamG-like jellyroll fold domain-containing protein [Chitinophaga sp. CB10]
MKKIYVLSMGLLCAQLSFSQTRKVLLLGIDGCRHDAVIAANAPTLDSLIANSVYSFDALTETPTWSAVGWSAMLTGVWRNKTGVADNSFSGSSYAVYKSFLERVENLTPARRTVSVAHWAPINTYIVNNVDAEINVTTDLDVKNNAVAELANNNPDVLFVDFDDVDHAGHSYGFGPNVSQYINAIQTTDGYIKNILTALKSRPNYANEDWLVAVTTDHGGNMAGHGGSSFEERNIFSVFSNARFTPAQISKQVVSFNMGGQYLSFDNGAFVQAPGTPYNFGAATDFTIECRVKLSPGFSGDPAILSNKNWANGLNKGFVLSAVNGNSWKVNVGDGAHRVDMNGNIIADGRWHHLAIVCKRNGNISMYEDGTLISSKPMTAIGDVSSGLPLGIGQDGTLAYGYHPNGSIAEVRIWNKALPEPELITWMSQPVTAAHPSYANLLTYFKGDEGSGATWVNAKGGSNGTITGTPVWQGAVAQPAALNFSAAYARPLNALNYQFDNSDFTMECKVKIANWSGDPAILSDKNWASGTNKGYVMALTSSGWKVNIGDGSGRVDLNGGALGTNTWHHLAFTVSRSGNLTTYVDGVQTGATPMTAVKKSIASGLPFAIGQDGTLAYGYAFQGNISDVRIWNKVLSAAVINSWKNTAITASHPDYASLVGYWPGHEGRGNTLLDGLNAGNNAAITGVANWQSPAPDTTFTYGVFNNTPRQVDMAVSCLDFLGIDIDTAWHLDGRSWIPPVAPLSAAKQKAASAVMMTIAPNPVAKNMRVNIEAKQEAAAILVLYNLQRQPVKVYRQQLRKGRQQLALDVPELPVGVYFLDLHASGAHSAVKIFVQQ